MTTHTEPFHASKAIATVDFVSGGRAGVLLDIDTSPNGARLVGRRSLGGPGHPTAADLYAEAGDHAEVLRRLWDSWEDDAEFRDTATGQFIDQDRLHHIDFEGRFFSVRGPSITPRPPQGNPLIAGAAELGRDPAEVSAALGFLGDSADVVFLAGDVAAISRSAERLSSSGTLVFADLLVFLDDATAAADRRAQLDQLLGSEFGFGTSVFTGTAGQLAEHVAELTSSGTGIDGVRLHPAAIPTDLEAIAAASSILADRGVLAERGATLRAGLRLARPANRYAAHDHSRAVGAALRTPGAPS